MAGGAWDALVGHEISLTRHPDIAWQFEDWKVKQGYAYYGPTVRTAFTAGAEWVLSRLREWDSLTESEAIQELRKGEQSVFHPLFADDPRIFADCPNHGRVSTGPEGTCDQCLYDFTAH